MFSGTVSKHDQMLCLTPPLTHIIIIANYYVGIKSPFIDKCFFLITEARLHCIRDSLINKQPMRCDAQLAAQLYSSFIAILLVAALF